MIPTYLLLAGAIVSLWVSGDQRGASIRRYLWLILWLGSMVSALVGGVLTSTGAVGSGVFLAAVVLFQRARSPWSISLLGLIVAGLAIGLMLHVLPGFHNPRVIDAVRFTSDAVPYTLYLNYDKTLIGLFILGCCHQRIERLDEWRAMLAKTVPWAAVLIGVLMVTSLAAGYVRLAPKFPAESGLWLAANLIFACVAEEALFRGFIQERLQRLWSAKRGGEIWALAIAALVFGFAHFRGGPAYVALATIAGLGYGGIYLRTRRIEASILTHCALNTTHFFLFTYPALADAVRG